MRAWLRQWWQAPAPEPAAGTTWCSAIRSDVGRVRLVNEDRVLARPDRGLWAVADGMGGHSGGDVAADLAIRALDALADDDAPLTEANVRGALSRAHDAIVARVGQSGHVSGTTIIVMLVAGSEALMLWAGDSRGYRLGSASRLVTRDHSLVQEMVDAGAITPAEARSHPRANVVTRALGVEGMLRLETVPVALAPGDRLLLCSDGVSRSLATHDLEIAALEPDLEVAADRLLAAALARDGSDNASLVLIARAAKD